MTSALGSRPRTYLNGSLDWASFSEIEMPFCRLRGNKAFEMGPSQEVINHRRTLFTPLPLPPPNANLDCTSLFPFLILFRLRLLLGFCPIKLGDQVTRAYSDGFRAPFFSYRVSENFSNFEAAPVFCLPSQASNSVRLTLGSAEKEK